MRLLSRTATSTSTRTRTRTSTTATVTATATASADTAGAAAAAHLSPPHECAERVVSHYLVCWHELHDALFRQRHRRLAVVYQRVVERWQTIAARPVLVCPSYQQHQHHLLVAAVRSKRQRREPILVGSMHVCPLVQQRPYNCGTLFAVGCCRMINSRAGSDGIGSNHQWRAPLNPVFKQSLQPTAAEASV